MASLWRPVASLWSTVFDFGPPWGQYSSPPRLAPLARRQYSSPSRLALLASSSIFITVSFRFDRPVLSIRQIFVTASALSARLVVDIHHRLGSLRSPRHQ
jgi:hypothetical protein